MASTEHHPRVVWRAWTLALGEGRTHTLGPTRLWIGRLGGEWRVASVSAGDPQDPTVDVEAAAAPPEGLPEPTRVLAGPGDDYALRPHLADRSVVVRPEGRLVILPGCEATLYVSTPVWWQLTIGDRLAADRPVFRPADTWFGPSPRDGALCYANRTRALSSFDGVAPRPARAATRLQLSNERRTPLEVERLALPMRELDLSLADDGHLWTAGVRLEVGEGGVDVTLDAAPPAEAGPTERLTPPRDVAPRSRVVRALSALLL